MKLIKCETCGSSDFVTKGNSRICRFCGAEYQLFKEDVGVKDTSIDLNDDILRLLQKAKDEPEKAKKYANLILDIDPTNKEALKLLM